MRNSIILSVFMLVGVFATTELATQKADANDFIKKTATVENNDTWTPCKAPSETSVADHLPRVMRASLSTPASTQIEEGANATPPNCKPADCKKVTCDPANCKKVTCDPSDCPPQCRPLCGKAASVANKQAETEVGCKPAAAVAKAFVAEGR